jgi:DNA helicase IV
MVSAEMLVDRFTAQGPRLTVAEHADRDRTWTFGHVVVDEAQELSAMQWRVLVRRCPSRSFTVVGDVAQTGAASGTTDWASTLDAFADGRWRIEELTVNYRTPRRIVAYAEDEVRQRGLEVSAQRTLREGDRDVQIHPVAELRELVALVTKECDLLGDGRLAVITVDGDDTWAVPSVRRALEAEWSSAVGGDAEDALDHQVAVLDPTACKGLEVDAVVVVDPEAIVAAGEGRGASDLFVALTRATQSLIIAQPVGAR